MVRKGYYRYPEVKEDAQLSDVANECWALHLARNWSLFGFLFTGQLSSQLACKVCHKSSWSFEPFMSISLPMSLCETVVIDVTVALLPARKRRHLVARQGQGEDLIVLRNELPRLVTVLSEANGTVTDLVAKLYGMKGLPLLPQSPLTSVEVCLVLGQKVVQIFRPQEKLSLLEQYSKGITAIWAFETMAELTRGDRADCSLSSIDVGNLTGTPAKDIDRYTLFLGFPLSKAGGLAFNLPPPKEHFVHLINRCILPNQKLLWKKREPRPCGNPMLIRFTQGCSGAQFYESVWEAATAYLRPGSRYLQSENLWWNPRFAASSGKRPFVLRIVGSTGRGCARCPWGKQCLGCDIDPACERLELHPEEFVAIDWYLDVYAKDYVQTYDREQHESVEEARRIANRPRSLYDFLDKFTAPEELEHRECESCHARDTTKKRLAIFRAPPVFIIHLKRYEQKYDGDIFRSFRVKNNTVVDFPLENFDVQRFVNSEAAGRCNPETKYDLYAIIVRIRLANCRTTTACCRRATTRHMCGLAAGGTATTTHDVTRSPSPLKNSATPTCSSMFGSMSA